MKIIIIVLFASVLSTSLAFPTSEHSNSDVKCGVRGRQSSPHDLGIINGQNAERFEFPWQVNVDYGNCGGSIINQRWVVTAAHCAVLDVAPFMMQLIFGLWNQSDGSEDSRFLVPVEKIILHPKYDEKVGDYDIALAKLVKDLDFTNPNHAVGPICLPDADTPLDALADTDCTVTGWGATYFNTSDGARYADILQKANLTVVRQAECVKIWTDKPDYGHNVTNNMICARHPPQTGCHGDSGGPLVCYNKTKGSWTLNGIVSWGEIDCNKLDHPNVFARVSALVPWILQTIKDN